MALSPPVPREPMHQRRYQFDGYRRADGLWDVDAHLTDTKTHGFKNEWRGEITPGEPIHDMWIRLTVDEDLVVRDIEVVTAAAPFQVCAAITPDFAVVKGLRVGTGWQRAIRERLGGVRGCTHQVEMLGAMATAVFQTLFPVRRQAERAAGTAVRPPILDTCHALASDGPVVKRFWPAFYTGDKTR